MGMNFAEMHPELASEFSERNLPLMASDITYGSNKKYWWSGKCGHEWLASPKSRHSGEGCPYCAGMQVLEGFNDLASVRPELVDEWSSENEPLKPNNVNAASHRKVKWKGKCGHSWNAFIYNRTVNGEGCLECEKEFKSVLPQLAVLYYAGKYGLKTKLNDESAIGIHLDTYIPSIGIAIETGGIRNSKTGIEEYGIKRLQCKKRGIKLYTITEGNVPNDRIHHSKRELLDKST